MGPAVRYGSVSPTHKERFEPGSFTQSLARDTTRWLDVQHEFNQVIAYTGAGLELRDSAAALEVVATLPRIPAADLALAAVKRGELRGFSIEFFPEAERRDDGIRVIEKAHLQGLGLVADPSYPESTAEIRRGRGGFSGMFRASTKYYSGKKYQCECSSCDSGEVEFEPGAITKNLGDREVLAVHGRYSQAVASRSKGTLRIVEGKRGVEVAIDIDGSTQAGAAVIEQSRATRVLARPMFDESKSVYKLNDAGVAIYKKLHVKSVIIGPTDADAGWNELDFAAVEAKREARSRLLLF